MSLEGLVMQIEEARKREQERWMMQMREQHESAIRAKDEEIAALKEEIECLRTWLDHSALPVANPISKRPDSLGLIKLNFGKEKPCPDMWHPGEKAMLDSVRREEPVMQEPEEGLPNPLEPLAPESDFIENQPQPELQAENSKTPDFEELKPLEPLDFEPEPEPSLEAPEEPGKTKASGIIKKIKPRRKRQGNRARKKG